MSEDKTPISLLLPVYVTTSGKRLAVIATEGIKPTAKRGERVRCILHDASTVTLPMPEYKELPIVQFSEVIR